MELSTVELMASLAIVLFGAYVRGFTGFGASLVWAGGLTLLLPPSAVVPTIFVLEVAASASLITRAWLDVDWVSVRWLLLGAVVGTPIGTMVLRAVDEDTMGLVVSVTVLTAAVLLASGIQVRRMPTTGEVGGTGFLSGLLNGATAAGGPPVIVLFLGTPAAIAVGRATMIAYFGLLDVWGIGNQVVGGGFNSAVLARTAAFLPPMLVGVKLGERGFGVATERQVRAIALVVLAAIGVIGVVNWARG